MGNLNAFQSSEGGFKIYIDTSPHFVSLSVCELLVTRYSSGPRLRSRALIPKNEGKYKAKIGIDEPLTLIRTQVKTNSLIKATSQGKYMKWKIVKFADLN